MAASLLKTLAFFLLIDDTCWTLSHSEVRKALRRFGSPCEQHETREGVRGFAIGGKIDTHGTRGFRAKSGGGVDQEDLFLGDVGHEEGGMFRGMKGTSFGFDMPEDFEEVPFHLNGDRRKVRHWSVTNGGKTNEVDMLLFVGDDGIGGNLL